MRGPGEVALQAVGDQLEQPLPAVEAAQLVEAEVEQADAPSGRSAASRAVDAEQST